MCFIFHWYDSHVVIFWQMRFEIFKTSKFIFEELMRIASESLNQMPVEIRKIIQVTKCDIV